MRRPIRPRGGTRTDRALMRRRGIRRGLPARIHLRRGVRREPMLSAFETHPDLLGRR